MNTENSHSDIIEKTINELSHSESYNLVYIPLHGRAMPSVAVLGELVDKLREVIFPGYFGNSSLNKDNLPYHIGVNVDMAYHLLCDQIYKGICFACSTTGSFDSQATHEKAAGKAAKLIACLPEIRRLLATDVIAAYRGDPAANSEGEVIFSYPSIRALTNHRIAHELNKAEIPLIPRIISEMAHSETGIDIHPGATIGEYFAIDHGTGVVIGETATIGNNVKLYQGVTLGARSFPLDENGNPIKGIPRHPIVEDDVVIYSNATILGRITVGRGAVIGGNIWVTRDVPANSKISQQKPVDNPFTNGGGI